MLCSPSKIPTASLVSWRTRAVQGVCPGCFGLLSAFSFFKMVFAASSSHSLLEVFHKKLWPTDASCPSFGAFGLISACLFHMTIIASNGALTLAEGGAQVDQNRRYPSFQNVYQRLNRKPGLLQTNCKVFQTNIPIRPI